MKTYEQTVEEIEKEWKDKFHLSLLPLLPMIPNKNIPYEMKVFINKALSRIRHQTIEEVREKMPKRIKASKKYNNNDPRVEYIYNLALSDIHRILKEMDTEK